jgi:succinyl-CoA synthetase beta subunit
MLGGIVRCDSIAQGLINTVANQAINIPIVARLQGTNMKEAQQLVPLSHFAN